MHTIKYYTTALLSIFLLVTACSDDNSTDDGDVNFDRSAMIENFGNNIILPAYDNMLAQTVELDEDISAFIANPDVNTLQSAQENLKEARLAWQRVNLFQFGPAETVALRTFTNTFPTDTAKIESNIESGSFTLGTADNQSAGGFPAFGYLLHGLAGNNDEIVALYTTADDADARLNYLRENMDFVASNIENVVNEWKADGGDYIGTFLSEENAGVDVGSSLGLLFNAAMDLHYQRFIRDAKIGIPAGVRSANIPRPDNVEAVYSGYSLELAKANMQAIQDLYLGRTAEGTDGIGLEENLQSLEANDLDEEIKTGFEEVLTSLDNLQDPLHDQIEEDNEPVLDAFVELLEMVELFKADMASRLGVTITFQDNDGD